MKGSMFLGMVAGSVLGVAATMIAIPFMQPQLHKAVRKGRRAVNRHLDKMDHGWHGHG